MRILTLLQAREIISVATKIIDGTMMQVHEQKELINNEIDNYDLIIVSVWFKSDYYEDNKKIISGREFVKNIKYYLREEK